MVTTSQPFNKLSWKFVGYIPYGTKICVTQIYPCDAKCWDFCLLFFSISRQKVDRIRNFFSQKSFPTQEESSLKILVH